MRAPRSGRSSCGFTLIEVMIVVAIVARNGKPDSAAAWPARTSPVTRRTAGPGCPRENRRTVDERFSRRPRAAPR